MHTIAKFCIAVYKGFNATNRAEFESRVASPSSDLYDGSDTYYTPDYDPLLPDQISFDEYGLKNLCA